MHADHVVLAPFHPTLIELAFPLLPKEYFSRQRDGHEQADDAFDEAGLIDEEDLAVFGTCRGGEVLRSLFNVRVLGRATGYGPR